MRNSAINIIQKLQDSGYTAYLAGGCVRDALLKIENKDYDIVTSATPKEVQSLFPKANSVGAHFGVMLVKKDGHFFDVATFRTDGDYKDNRRPESVHFATPQEDAFRRDFTINGLFECPISGTIDDYVDGRKDIEQRIIRAIGAPEERFQEDGLRLLRAIRFATTLDFTIDSETWLAIQKHAHLLKNISIERVRQEFSKIISHENRAQGLHLLVESGLMDYIIPEVLDLRGCDQPPQFHPEGDVYTHTHLMLGLLAEPSSLGLCLAVLLHDIGKPATRTYDKNADRVRFNGHAEVGAKMSEKILNRLKYPKELTQNVVSMVNNHMNFMNVSQMKKSTLRKFLARATFQEEMELHRVDCLGSNGNLSNYDFLRKKEKDFQDQAIIPEPLITGRHLIAMGFQAGSVFSQILHQVQEQQLEGNLTSEKAALEYVRTHFHHLSSL